MEAPARRPTLFMLAGPNGAGKSTLYETVIRPKVKAPFINADLIQKSELEDQSMEAAYRAAEIAATRRDRFLHEQKSFVSESTFSHLSKLKLIDSAKDLGFRILVFHINVRDPKLSIARVACRVEEGGHNVPEDKIIARYIRNQPLIHQAVLKGNRSFVYDNSLLNSPPQLILSFAHGRIERVADSIPAWVKKLYGNELKTYHKIKYLDEYRKQSPPK